MIHIKGVFNADGQGKLIIADGTQPFDDALGKFEAENGPITSSTAEFNFTHGEFCDDIMGNIGGVCCVGTPEDAVEWAVKETSPKKIIRMLDEPEDSAKEYLEDEGYVVFTDEDSAVEALREKICVEGGPSTAIHAQYAQDVWAKIHEMAGTHGWLHVLNKLEA